MTTTLNSETRRTQRLPWAHDPHTDPSKPSVRYKVPWAMRHFAFDYIQGTITTLAALYDHAKDFGGTLLGVTERPNSIDNPNEFPELTYEQVKKLHSFCIDKNISLKEGFAILHGLDMLSQREQLVYAKCPDVFPDDSRAQVQEQKEDEEAKLAEFKAKLAKIQAVPSTAQVVLKK